VPSGPFLLLLDKHQHSKCSLINAVFYSLQFKNPLAEFLLEIPVAEDW